jgi:sirohydrochlorin cobaltochelatase
METFEALEIRLKAILPEEYQDSCEDVQPVSMGSAALKYLKNGKVAWNDIWETFCDLAMAGGPPHKGSLLEPGSQTDIDAHPDRYQKVVEEICRGITMVTYLEAHPSPVSGWVRVDCENDGMAGWLARAIVMENVSVRFDGSWLDLPAGPHYRLEKEIKNVVTVISKTCHYWNDHMWQTQQRDIAALLAGMAVDLPLIEPAFVDGDRDKLAGILHQATGLRPSGHHYVGWLGLECPDVRSAIWMMRALVVSNIFSRREGTVLFVPVNPATDPEGQIVARSMARIHGFAVARSLLGSL